MSSPKKPRPGALEPILRFLGSIGLTIVILALLLVLTFAGTLAQRHQSLYDVQTEYFESAFVLVPLDLGLFEIPLPIPGAYLLLSVLAANLLVGGLLRIRKSEATVGVIVVHVGMLGLLAGGFVEYHWSDEGHMSVFEGQSSREFQSYYDWELAVVEQLDGGEIREHVVPHEYFEDLDEGESRRVVSKLLPFDLVLSDFSRNARPYRVAGEAGEGVRLEAKDPDAESAERNLPGLTLQVMPKQGATRHEVLLWGGQRFPATARVAGQTWQFDLRHSRWELPFEIRLDDFVMEKHPGTSMASRYSSYVTKDEDGAKSKIHITMNEPLRHEGYTLYQSGWGPPNAPPGTPLYSVFSVVRNPADDAFFGLGMPLVACIVIGLGMVIVFGRKLFFYMRAEARRNA